MAAPQMMTVPTPSSPMGGAVYVADAQREPKHHPGRLIYTAQFEHEKLVCLYRVLTFPYCCGVEEMARNTHYDVYSNAVVLVRPGFYPCSPDCCCGRQAWGLTRYYDHTSFDEATSANRICGQGCWTLVGWMGKFGEQLNMHNHFINVYRPSSLGHLTVFQCCSSVESVYGLKDGEAARLSGIVNEQVRVFRSNPQAYALDAVAAYSAKTVQV